MLLLLLLLILLFAIGGVAFSPLLWLIVLVLIVAYALSGPRSGRWY